MGKPFAGKGKELYIESVFVNENHHHQPVINMTVRLRADVDQDYRDCYVTNREYTKDGHRCFSHSQMVTLKTLNRICELSQHEKYSDDDVLDAMDSKKPLVSCDDNLAFISNVYFRDEDRDKHTYLFNEHVIEPSKVKFKYERQKEYRQHKNQKSPVEKVEPKKMSFKEKVGQFWRKVF